MKRFSLLPNVITAFGLSCGLFVIYRSIGIGEAENPFSLLQSAAILILIAAFADVADGAIARLIKAESDFGGEFDSLSDSVTFGVAPPLLIIKSLTDIDFGRLVNLFFIVAAMIYTLCGVLRLVRYNLHRKGKKPDQSRVPRHYFVGLPIPAASALVTSACLMLISPWAEVVFPFTDFTKVLVMMGIFILIGYCMVCRWRFPSLAALYFRVPTFYLVLLTGIIAVFLLSGILDYFAWVYFILSWGYLLFSFLALIYGYSTGKQVLFKKEKPKNKR